MGNKKEKEEEMRNELRKKGLRKEGVDRRCEMKNESGGKNEESM